VDPDVLVAALAPVVPPRGDRHHALRVLVVQWYLPSHSDGSPPSPPSSKLLIVMMALVCLVTGGEHRYVW
jgi:hypothetical protein